MVKIAVIPIDNRPICYDLIQDILNIDKEIELLMPRIESLGDLKSCSKIDEIFKFIEDMDKVDYFIVSLDTIAYGGLITSRRCSDDFNIIKNRIEKFKNLISSKCKHIFAFSSIMRISNNNINEEEKEYWSQWGKRIFDWSYYLHKSELEKTYNCVHNFIPENILDDYIQTRKRNFEINKLYLSWAKEGFFDTLIFSKDDCSKYGLNVKEANEIEKIIKKENIKNVLVKTGADEIPLSLLSRAINNNISIKPIFLYDNAKELISKYEDIPLEKCVIGQCEIAKLKIKNENFDLAMLINNFEYEQGDLVLGEKINTINKKINFPNKKYFIADVNNANGSDVNFVQQLFCNNINNFYGYCGYNTSANTIGATIFCAIIKYQAIKNNSYNENSFKKYQFIRFLDDYVYQAIYRKEIKKEAPNFKQALENIENKISEKSKEICEFLNFYPQKITYSLPWDRSFEIRIKIL